MAVKRYRVVTFSQYKDDKKNKEYVKVIINARTKELKQAIVKYSESINTSVSVVIGEALQKMVDSKDYSISVFRVYDESSVSGIDTRENMISRQISLDFDPGIINSVDKTIKRIKDELPKSKITRLLFIQEAIKRYLEPELIRLNLLEASVFKDKLLAAKNLTTFRKSMEMSRNKFIDTYLTIEGKSQISYPQYTVIENSGKGNIDRILDLLTEKLNLEKDVFYESELSFKSRFR